MRVTFPAKDLKAPGQFMTSGKIQQIDQQRKASSKKVGTASRIPTREIALAQECE